MTRFKRLVNATSAQALGLLAAACCATSSLAAPVHYTFELKGGFAAGPVLGSFSYTAPDFITADTTPAVASLDSCTPPAGGSTCGDPSFHPSSLGFSSALVDIADVVAFALDLAGGNGQISYHYFADGAFQAAGVYDAILLPGDFSRLIVTVDPTSNVPEPASLPLTALALGAAVALGRRKTTAG